MKIAPLRLRPFHLELIGLSWLASPGQPTGDVVTCQLRCYVYECTISSEIMVNLQTGHLVGGYGDPRCHELIDQALELICHAACRLLSKPIPKWRLL